MTHSPALQRLDRLEGYLREDPDNLSLLGETFELALQAGELARAEIPLRHGLALAAGNTQWQLREVHWLLAQHRWAEAELLLHPIALAEDAPAELRPVAAHDLAYCLMQQGRSAEGYDALSPWVKDIAPSEAIDPALQVQWLRLAHRAGKLEEAMAWARARWPAQQLAAPAAGVASLIALDAEDFAACLLWSDHALKEHGGPMEAMVARASAALAQQDPVLSRTLLDRVLQLSPQDGRAWSALAFTDLLEQKADAARASFHKAVHYMPEHVGTWHGLGWTCLLQRDLDGALQAFEQALALDRNFGESHGGLAVVQAARNERAAAEESIERALRLDRSNLSARYAQAVLSGEAGDLQALRRLATRLLGSRTGPMGGSMLDMLPQLVEPAGLSGPESGQESGQQSGEGQGDEPPGGNLH